MNIFIAIPHHFVATTIATACIREGNTCTIYTIIPDFGKMLKIFHEKTDLLVLDYLLFNHDLFNIYKYMREKSNTVPIIFYNDPIPHTGMRHVYWETMLSNVYTGVFHAEPYRKILRTIASTVESDFLRPYIPLLQPPRQEPVLNQENHKRIVNLQPQTKLDYLGKYLRLSGTLFLIFEVLYKNRNTTINAVEIKSKLTKSGSPIKTATVYALIKRLRERLTATQDLHANIITTAGGYQLLLNEEKEKDA